MDFSQIDIKKILGLVFILLITSKLCAQNSEYNFEYKITILENSRLEVKIINLNNRDYPLSLVFPKQIPNFYNKQIDIRSKISDVILSFKDQLSSLVLKDDRIVVNHEFDYVSYKVKLNAFEKEQFLPVTSFVVNEEYMLLNFATFLANVEDGKRINLRIVKYDKTVLSNNNITSLYEYPICIGCLEINKVINEVDLHIEFTRNEIINEIKFFKLIDESIELFDNFDFPEEWESKKMIFIIDSLNENTGAIAHENCIVFYFNKADKFTIQKTTIHEILHWTYPSLNKWLNESAVEYLALKLMLKSDLITEEKFLSILSDKLRSTDKIKNYSLQNLFKNQTDLSITDNYKALYTKGAVYAFLLDNLLLKAFDFKYSLEYIINNTDRLTLAEAHKLANVLNDFREDYVEDNKTVSYNKFLNHLGLLFEENKLVSIKQKQKIVLDVVADKIIVKENAGIDVIYVNDRLLKLDGKRKLEDINEKLFSMSDKNSRFVVIRNNKRLKVKVNNKETLIERQKHVVSFFENRTNLQKTNWEKYKEK